MRARDRPCEEINEEQNDVGAPQQKPVGENKLKHPRRPRVAVLALALASMFPASLFNAADAADPDVNEFTVKAAYISKFGGFIRWPEGAFSSDTSPITICVMGDSPVGSVLAKSASRPIGNRPVAIRTIKAFAPGSGCHILYAGDSNAERISQILKAARGSSVLTVTDVIGAEAGAPVINFVMKENHVRFEIDEGAASDNGLTISSQLLGLAVSVKTRG
jgi:hypothetical protein